MKSKRQKLDEKFKSARNCLDHCYCEHRSNVEARIDARKRIEDGGRLTFRPAGEAMPEDFRRLKAWLNHMAEHDPPETVAYAALLQIWLAAKGIGWPREVFVNDYAILGSGRPRGKKYAKGAEIAERINGTVPNWTEIGAEYFPEAKTVREAADAARLAVRTFVESVRFGSIDDREIVEAAHSMLGWEWYQDFLDREIEPER